MKYLNALSLILFMLLAFTACVDQDFDAPPAEGQNLDLEPNTTISELKERHIPGEFYEITEDMILKATVVGDDQSGNFFRALAVQDETAGITLHLDATNLYNDFPVGRTVFIQAQGMWMSDYNGLIQLGGGVYLDDDGEQQLSRVSELLLDKYLIKGPLGEVPAPIELSISEIDKTHVSMLVTLKDVQFTPADAGETYADAINRFSLNRILEDCEGNETIIRTSGYADFANDITPTGKGSITAIMGIFGSDFQLTLRDLDDVQMDDERCGDGGGSGGGGMGGGDIDPVDSIEEDFQGGNDNEDVNLTGWSNIATKGTRLWRFQEFDGNIYAQATAYQDSEPEMEVWLVTPPVNFDEAEELSFESAQAFYNHNGLSVWISFDYDGENIEAASWEELTEVVLASAASGDHNWVPSSIVDLSQYDGKGHVAFRYVGNPSNGTTSYRVDNILIE